MWDGIVDGMSSSSEESESPTGASGFSLLPFGVLLLGNPGRVPDVVSGTVVMGCTEVFASARGGRVGSRVAAVPEEPDKPPPISATDSVLRVGVSSAASW